MSKKISTLQELAYKSIPRETYKLVKNTPSKEQLVLQSVKEDVTKNYKTFNTWVKSIKIPKEAKELLIIFNTFTKPDFYNSYTAICRRVYKIKDMYSHHIDYLLAILLFLNDKNLFDQELPEEEQKEGWKRHHYIVMEVYNILCYKRLKDKLNVDYMYEKEQLKILKNTILPLEENDLLPYIIYHFVDKYNFNIDT